MNFTILGTISAILIFSLLITMWFYHERSIRYKMQIDSFTSQLESLSKQSEELRKRYYQSQLEALAEMEKQKKETEEILSSKVSKNCKEAMRWGIEQAKRLS